MNFDVVIAGAGPVGLFLACELRLAGVSVVVLEQAAEADSPLKRLPFGRRGLWAAALEGFARRGLLDPLRTALGDPESKLGDAHWARGPRTPSGHFAGIPFYEEPPVGSSLMVDTLTLETVLAARAVELGVEIRRGEGVVAFEQLDDAVTVGGVRGSWLVGCDGGRSTVRKAAGFEFAGTEPEFTGYQVLVSLEDPQALPQGRHYTEQGMFTYAQSGSRPAVVALADFDGAAHHRAENISREHVESVLRRISGVEVRVTALHQSTTFTDRAYQASRYRRGRVLLAGDAAHIHSPLGGQGLNLGLGDALNLGWKLAATVQERAPEGLLDTYESERMPVASDVLDWSRAQVALMRPSRSSRALEAILRDLIATPDGTAYFAARVAGRSLRYDLGDDHPLVGRSAPDFRLAEVDAALRAGRGVLLDFQGVLEPVSASGLDYVRAAGASDFGGLLIRPDGVVAWVSEGSAELGGAVSRWF